MVILEPDKIQVILNQIKEHDLVNKLHLTTGNCGVFAIALKHLTGLGELYGINSHCHIVLKLARRLYVDGTGMMNVRELKEEWSSWGWRFAPNDDERDIVEGTSHSFTVIQMEHILQMLAEETPIKDVMSYATKHDEW